MIHFTSDLQPASEYKRRHELSLYYRLLALVDAEIDLTDDPIELSGLLDERAGCVMDATELGTPKYHDQKNPKNAE